MWQAFEVVFRLRSPLHIGCGKVGNLQRTRPYVTGRALWGALTMRLTRDAAQGNKPATDSREYRKIGEQVNECLAFTYFYTALKCGDGYQVAWPWENENTFRRRFLSSYQGTALSYPQQSAAEGMLYEFEFISPRTVDTGQTVFLRGYVFEKEGCPLDWRSAFKRLQMGGERGYGWGDVELVNISPCADTCLFGGPPMFKGDGDVPVIARGHAGGFHSDDLPRFKGDGDVPVISLPKDRRLLAHTLADALPIVGDVEPLVGREWHSDNPQCRYVGQHVEFSGLCFAPGSETRQKLDFAVTSLGVWRKIHAKA